MIRVGARAPPPPPLPTTTPTNPKPPHSRGAEGYRVRLVHRARQARNLREKVVQLASQKEKQHQQQRTDGIIRLPQPQNSDKRRQYLEDTPEQGQNVTIEIYDLKRGGGVSVGKNVVGSSAPYKAGNQTKREQSGLVESNVNANLAVARVPSQKSPPDSTPFPRNAAQRIRSSHPQFPASVLVHESSQPSPKHPSVPTSGIPPQPSLRQVHEAPQEDHQKHKVTNPQTTTATTITTTASRTRSTAARTTRRSLKTPPRGVMAQRASEVHGTSTPSGSPRSQDSQRGPGSRDIITGHTDCEESCKQMTTPSTGHLSSPSHHHPSTSRDPQKQPVSRDANRLVPEVSPKQTTELSNEQPPSPSDPASRPGRSVNYRRAARAIRAQHAPGPPGTDPHWRQGLKQPPADRPKTVHFLSDDTTRQHYSSGSLGGSPRQQATRGAEEAVGEVKGNAVPPSPHHLHTQLTPRRADHKNPSHFASSLEMFKRRLKMNHCRIVTDQTTEEEDYVIRLGGTIPISESSWQQISGFKLRPHEPHSPSSPPPSQHHHHHHPEANHLGGHQTNENHQKTKASWKTATAQQESQDHGFGDLTYGRELRLHLRTRGKEEMRAEKKMEEEDGGSGAVEEGGKDHTTTPSCKFPESSENWTYVPLGDAARVPLPQVKTYVVENDLTLLLHAGAQSHLPLALTQHNVHLHDIFLQRRSDREKMRQKRAELERRAGFISGGRGRGGEEGEEGGRGGEEEVCRMGCLANADAESRMRRWLVDTEYHQCDQQPLVNFKIAIPAA